MSLSNKPWTIGLRKKMVKIGEGMNGQGRGSSTVNEESDEICEEP
jgi:hypothetical protein